MKAGILVVVVALAGFAGYQTYTRVQLTDAFAEVALDETTSDQVLDLTGYPDAITGCTSFRSGAPQQSPADDCWEIYWFDVPFATQMHSYAFNAEGVVVHKYNWVSW